jgi:CubicO group peptidase (beta-lactamase class C family)
MNTVGRVLVLLAAAALPLAAAAQTVRPEQVGLSSERLQRINELVERHIEAGNISGAVTLVARNGRIAHLAAQGMMDIETNTPMRTDTIFRIASMTKPVVSAAVMLLVEEGKIRLTDPISRFVPGFAEAEVAVLRQQGGGAGGGGVPTGGPGGSAPNYYTVPVERALTILDVLTHTGGVMSGQVGNAGGQPHFGRRMDAGLTWSEALTDVPLDFQPGSRWSYSGLGGFDLLARIVEIVSGQRFEAFLAERIFQPLGARDIFFWPSAQQRERLVGNYIRGQNGLVPRPDPDMLHGPNYSSGSGGLMATAEAYARVGMMLANDGEWNGTRILSPRSVELIRSPLIPDTLPGRQSGESFGLGVRVVTDPVARRSMVSKGSYGWAGAYGTHFWADPDKNLVGILMIQTPTGGLAADFETAVMQALLD